MKSKKLSPLAVYLVCAAAIVLLLAADQYTKSLAVQYLKDQPSIKLIPGVLELFYLETAVWHSDFCRISTGCLL